MEVKIHLNQAGYDVEDLTYHKNLSSNLKERLRKLDSPTALLIRTRADRICVNKNGDTFMLEAKTHASKIYRDCTIELLPLAHHISVYHDFKVKCMYVYRNDNFSNIKHGFYAEDAPNMVDKIFIPSRYQHMEKFFRNLAARFFPLAKIINIHKPTHHSQNIGSGDPFVTIPHEIIHKVKSFEQLLERHINTSNLKIAS